MAVSENEAGSVPSYSIFWNSLIRIWTVLCMFDRIPQWSHPILDFHLLGIFELHILFYFYWSVYSNYLLLNSILAGCLFLETCLFLLGCLFWHIILHIFFWYLVFLWYQLLFLLFSFLFCLFGSSLFFLVSLARGLLTLFILSKTDLLVLLIFFIVLLFCFLFYLFLLWFFYFLPSADCVLVVLFLILYVEG